MKTTNLNLVIGASLLVTAASFAQPQTQAQVKPNEIAETRDYVTGVINRMSGTYPGRYLISTDYSVAGPDFEKKKNAALTAFKSMMDYLAQGPFANSVDSYNSLIKDTSLSAEEKALRRESQLKSVKVQAKAAQAAYQAALRGLFLLEPALIRTEILLSNPGMHNNYNVEIKFADESVIKGKFNTDHKARDRFVESIVTSRIKDLLTKKCKVPNIKEPSQTCISSLLADLSAYYNDVSTQINQTLSIKLADGESIKLEYLKDAEYNWTLKSIEAFVFDDDYIKLPLKN